RAIPYSDRVTICDMTPSAVVEYGLALKVIRRESQRAGDIVSMSPEHAVLATYYRNNVLHLFALPSLIACCFLANSTMRTGDVLRLTTRIYPYVAAELFLTYREEDLPQIVEQTLAA